MLFLKINVKESPHSTYKKFQRSTLDPFLIKKKKVFKKSHMNAIYLCAFPLNIGPKTFGAIPESFRIWYIRIKTSPKT